TVRALERPTFAYTYDIVDNRKGNGDGRVQRDEAFTMYLTVKNVGKGKSHETQANVRNLSGDGLLLHEGASTSRTWRPATRSASRSRSTSSSTWPIRRRSSS